MTVRARDAGRTGSINAEGIRAVASKIAGYLGMLLTCGQRTWRENALRGRLASDENPQQHSTGFSPNDMVFPERKGFFRGKRVQDDGVRAVLAPE